MNEAGELEKSVEKDMNSAPDPGSSEQSDGPANGASGDDVDAKTSLMEKLRISVKSPNKIDDQESIKYVQNIQVVQPIQRPISVGTLRDETEYNMNHLYRGRCLIFNHENFDPSLNMNKRNGTNADRDELVRVFTYLGFNITVHRDYTKTFLLRTLEEAALEDHTHNDCFVCVVLTHGENGILFTRDNRYMQKDIYKPFLGDNSATLAGKPKLFFIQACQGDEVDSGVLVKTTQTDGHDIYSIPVHADLLISCSTVPGYFSWRNTTHGSWYIQSLCEILRTYAHKEDLLSMLTMVNHKVAFDFQSHNPMNSNMDRKRQIPSFSSMLTRKLYLRPKK